ncbi:MAG: hypothetical protein ACJAYG_002306 [Oceanicoccus sp.]|jgi:hypothetical protein
MADKEKKADDNQMKIIWDDSKMEMQYANVCNVSSTKEEFNLLFGANQSWAAAQKNIRIALSNRMILNPHAAKRLSVLLSRAVEQYEAKMGEIKLDANAVEPSIDEQNKH